jgi:hypothetical protein
MPSPRLATDGRAAALLVVACAALLTLGFASESAKSITASKWVTTVCKAETKLHSAVQGRFDALNAAASAGDVAAVKSAFVNLVGALQAPTKTLLSSLQKAGVPNVTNGKQIASTYVSTVQTVVKNLPALKTKVEAIQATDLAAFMAALNPALAPLNVTKTADSKVQTLDTDGKVATALGNCGGVFAAGGGQSGGNNANTPSTTGQRGGSSTPAPTAAH